jgi:GntR family transcriptional regulator / MocR family aminotransferase
VRRIAATLLPSVSVDRHSAVPIYAQIYQWFRSAIIEGRLRPGQRIPSTRSLASELHISRIPALNAYEQLRTEGYLKTLIGGGTRVAQVIVDEAIVPLRSRKGHAPLRGQVGEAPRRLSARGAAVSDEVSDAWPPRFGAFRVGLPALERFPVEGWAKLVTRQTRRLSKETMAYGDAIGYLPLREAIAEYLGTVRALRCDPSQILITTGSQQGLQLASQLLLETGDDVCIEEPGYGGAARAFMTVGAHVVPVPVDEEGLNVEDMIRQAPRARAVYITPSHQLPLGMTLSASRRMQLLHWASRSGAWIIEDDYDSEYRFASRPIGALQGMDTDARVIYLGTFSKVMFPALRLGYVVAPKDLVAAFCDVLDACGIFTSPLNQIVLTDFIREGHLARHIRRMRVLYMERREALAKALRRHFGDTLEVAGTEAGMHLVVLLPRGIDDRAVARRAAAKGISAMPLSTCYRGEARLSGLVLGYGGASIPQIQDGVRKLKTCLLEA